MLTKRKNRKKFLCKNLFFILLSLLLIFISTSCSEPAKEKNLDEIILVNHLGYTTNGPKHFVFQTKTDIVPESFKIVDKSGDVVLEGKFEGGGQIDKWHTGKAYSAYFSEVTTAGEYKVVMETSGKTVESELFEVKEQILAEKTLAFLLEGIKSQRAVGEYNEKDKKMTFFGDRKDTVDVSGGWYDASGDRSKYISHLSYANYMNPQQTPMFTWNFIDAYKNVANYKGDNAETLKKSLLNEAAYGADFLIRMLDPEGYFYMTVFDVWSWDITKREICAYRGQDGIKSADYQCGYREGGGMSVAVLARAAFEKINGEYTSQQYLDAAIKAFDHLEINNLKYLDNGEENIIDDYCALMAATELFNATNNQKYLTAARKRMTNLISRITDDEKVKGYWKADTKNERPFFHGADAGLPLVSLVRFLDVEKDNNIRKQAIDAIRKSVAFELNITKEVNNPFGYARQYVKSIDENSKRTAFFLAQKNETGYWWQGENARLGSLATAMFKSVPYLEDSQVKPALSYATNQINWILGLNPFDMTMLHGKGRNNPSYDPDYGGGVELNAKGCVCNGITGGFGNEQDIAFKPMPYGNDVAQKWRWSEQWLPHGSWLLAAISASIK